MLKEDVLPVTVVEGNGVPLCMQTFKFIFNCVRNPGNEMDKILLSDDSNYHIIVIR